ncbi:restriction endonuclease subunit S [Candidatus Microgenomates bacterium]|nr:restriction endonuclease subunit S [Candidatus Microgenomates bacterium]
MTTATQKIPSGYKQTDIGVIPADWDMKRLGDIGECLIGLTYKPSDVSHQGMLVLRSSNIQNDKLAFDDNVYVGVDVPEKIKVKNGDILICVRNGSRNLIGKCALLDSRVEGQTFGAFMSVFRTPYYGYIFHQFQSDNIQRQINENIGATINQITNKNLNSFRVAFPNKEEERSAISNVLSDSDGLIEKLERLIEKKKQIKQGTMQELLTGKRRLPGFSGKWESKTLEEIADVNMGQSPSSSSYNIAGHGIPLIQGNADIDNRKSIKRVWTTQKTKTCKAGDIIMTVRAPVGLVGIASEDSCLGRGVCSFKIKNIKKDFLFHSLIFNESAWKILEQGSTFTAANSSQIKIFGLRVPPTQSEQTAIATILSDMDTEIEKLESQLTKYQNLKQGMMQVLLTGKIRLLSK